MSFKMNRKPKIVVTGFGPFTGYPVNASWEAVKNMDKAEIERKHNCEVIVHEIPVAYKSVDEIVPYLWQTYNPKLMIHTGVSYLADCLTLETRAFKQGYELMDYTSYCPANESCPLDGAPVLYTKLNVERICREINVNSAYEKFSAVLSNDAGRYLCEYIYYTSLSVDSSRSLFIHVPETKDYASKRSARGLEKIVDLCLKQIDEVQHTQIDHSTNVKCICTIKGH